MMAEKNDVGDDDEISIWDASYSDESDTNEAKPAGRQSRSSQNEDDEASSNELGSDDRCSIDEDRPPYESFQGLDIVCDHTHAKKEDCDEEALGEEEGSAQAKLSGIRENEDPSPDTGDRSESEANATKLPARIASASATLRSSSYQRKMAAVARPQNTASSRAAADLSSSERREMPPIAAVDTPDRKRQAGTDNVASLNSISWQRTPTTDDLTHAPETDDVEQHLPISQVLSDNKSLDFSVACSNDRPALLEPTLADTSQQTGDELVGREVRSKASPPTNGRENQLTGATPCERARPPRTSQTSGISSLSEPGAYAAGGRAFGEAPAWIRVASWRNPLRERSQRAIPSSYRSRTTSRTWWIRGGTSQQAVMPNADVINEAETVVYASGVVSDDEGKKLRRKCIGSVVVLLLTIVGLVIGFTLHFFRDMQSAEGTMGTRSARCESDPAVRDVFDKCECEGTIADLDMTAEERSFYNDLNVMLLEQKMIDQLYEFDDCSPGNKAMVWLANYERLGFTCQEAEFASNSTLIQRYILALVFIELDGQNWHQNYGWMNQPHICDWAGLSCSYLDRVSELRLPQNGLKGTLLSELGKMPFLRTLDVSKNEISSTVPSDFMASRSIREINLGHNELTGPLPLHANMGSTTGVDSLILTNNSFTGAVPTEVGRFHQLRRLIMDRNNISGTIPGELGDLTNLNALQIDRNELQGTIPVELADLKQLEQIRLSANNFSGSLPNFIAEFERLEALFIFDTRLTGVITEQWCRPSTAISSRLVIANCEGDYHIKKSQNCSCCDFLQCVEELPPAAIESI